jgi:hypothetical protein
MTKKVNEGHLGDMAHAVERDHEVQMARAELYKIAKYAIKLHEMLKGVSEAEGIEGWQQSKITKAADYIGSVYHAMDYETKFQEGMAEGKYKSDAQRKAVHAAKADKKESTVDYKSKLGKVLETKLAEKLTVADGVEAWIKDFEVSNAPQFQGKSKEKRKEMAIAAFKSAESGGK